MRRFVLDTVPLGDRLTVHRIMQLYGWSAMIDHIERAYDLWRVVRPFVYPLAAVTQEVRERLGRKLYQWGRDELTTKLARHYVEEVGRAAVELYGGRLRVTAPALAAHVSPQTRRDRAAAAEAPAEPLRILVAGQVSAGKSSLINALSDAVRAAVDALPATASFAAYELSRPDVSRLDASRPDSAEGVRRGRPAALLLDSPGLRTDPAAEARLIAEAAQCDLVLWVVDASRADRENDRAALAAFRAHFGGQPNRRRPPVILVLTHIDRLRPFQEWQPPYDVNEPRGAKAMAIRAAMETVGSELGFALEDLVPCCLDEAVGRYNIDAVWAKVLATLPEAERAHLVRRLSEARDAWDWGRLWTQAVNAGRVIARAAVG
jgi:predicted GTPase